MLNKMPFFLPSAILLFALCGLTAQGEETAEETVSAAVSAAEAQQAPYKEFVSVIKEMTALLSKVKDRESADAAVPKLTVLVTRVKACEQKLHSDNAEQEEAQNGMGEVITALQALENQVNRLQENAFYGSESIIECFFLD